MLPPNTQCIHVPYPANSQEYAQLFADWQGFIWLDSGIRREYCSQFDLITARPEQALCAHTPDQVQLFHNDQCQSLTRHAAADWCEHWIKPSLDDACADLPFNGGLIGYIGYEWMHSTFKLPVNNIYKTPLLYLGVYEWALIIDHIKKSAFFVFTAQLPEIKRADILKQFNSPPKAIGFFNCSAFKPTTNKVHYLNDVQTILDYIYAGDCYQVNYSQAFTADFSGDAFAAYCRLRAGCPGPFSAFIKTDVGAILSLSPEQFIEIDNRQATSRPIKGTAARSNDPYMDTDAAEQLRQSNKNRAENLMIVDLIRNDFSKNCEPGSVKVGELFGLYSFTNVHHLISQINAVLKSHVSHWQFVMDAFPGGSITGAPKKRAMEIIDELEPHQRHIYCGSIGFFSRNGQTRTNIAIRTLLIENRQITLWGGGGIVADSIAEDEYRESLDKIDVFKSILFGASRQ
ncbi:MAG TPA: aminodeoxychorismate synthase component I [Cellvibrionaceae bacterium]